jgi:RNA polymerase sigma-70 factor (family 1)
VIRKSINVECDEKELIRRFKNGSIRAFDGIYDMYAKRLYLFSFQYTKVKEDAEEIVQDVFVQLWNNRTNIKQEETLKSLLFITAKNRLINAFRSHVNSPIYENYIDYQEKIVGNDYNSRIEYDDFVNQINNAIDKLPPTQQNVIRLSRFEQMNNTEIAKELSLSEQTVRNQLSVGLKCLRKRLLDATLDLKCYF